MTGEHAGARTSIVEALAPHAKALWATFGTAIVTLAYAAAPFTVGGEWGAITDGEWQLIFAAAPGAGIATWIAPKNRRRRRPARPAGGERVARKVRERGLI